jgi:hypothetical protein
MIFNHVPDCARYVVISAPVSGYFFTFNTVVSCVSDRILCHRVTKDDVVNNVSNVQTAFDCIVDFLGAINSPRRCLSVPVSIVSSSTLLITIPDEDSWAIDNKMHFSVSSTPPTAFVAML